MGTEPLKKLKLTKLRPAPTLYSKSFANILRKAQVYEQRLPLENSPWLILLDQKEPKKQTTEAYVWLKVQISIDHFLPSAIVSMPSTKTVPKDNRTTFLTEIQNSQDFLKIVLAVIAGQ